MRAILIIALVAGIALAGCANNADDPQTDPMTNTTNETEPEAEPTPEEPNCVAPAPVPCVEPPTA